MNKKLKIERSDEGTWSRIALQGIIDESSDFKEAFSGLKPNVSIDLKGIDLINSCGVREWVHAVEKLPAQSKVQYINCAPRIVEQINYVANFLGRGTVQSFYVPYFCPKCKKEANILMEVKDVGKARPVKAPPQKCPQCKGPMEFDDIEEEYFSFLDGDSK
jgi:DNA polymerase III, alpha subunit (gram-positive type)